MIGATAILVLVMNFWPLVNNRVFVLDVSPAGSGSQSGKKSYYSVEGAIEAVSAEPDAFTTQDLERLARWIVSKKTDHELRILVLYLWHDKTNQKTYLLSALIVKETAEQMKPPWAAARLGLIYRRGSPLPKNYVLALKYLNDAPETPRLNFAKATILLATDNKRRDEASGIALMKKSAAGGHAPAQDYLKNYQNK